MMIDGVTTVCRAMTPRQRTSYYSMVKWSLDGYLKFAEIMCDTDIKFQLENIGFNAVKDTDVVFVISARGKVEILEIIQLLSTLKTAFAAGGYQYGNWKPQENVLIVELVKQADDAAVHSDTIKAPARFNRKAFSN